MQESPLKLINYQPNEILKKQLSQILLEQHLTFSDEPIYHTPLFSNKKPTSISILNQISILKQNTSQMNYGPFKLLFDFDAGYYLVATDFIPKFTLLFEYSGDVIPDNSKTYSDSDFQLTKNTLISTIIHANIAKFVAGINNLCPHLFNENVKTWKCTFNKKPHILMYTFKDIQKGDVLYYNYNGSYNKGYNTSKFKIL